MQAVPGRGLWRWAHGVPDLWVAWQVVQEARGKQVCPECKSKGRHRHISWVLKELKLKPAQKSKALLIGGSAAELQMVESLEFDFVERMTLDNPSHGRVHLDMANMHLFTMKEFDLIVACHVLEHVRYLNQGLLEAYRALKPGGYAIFCVPRATRNKTQGRTEPVPPGHWWKIGRDWFTYYKNVGFRLRESYGRDCPEAYGVKHDNLVSICMK